MHRHVSGLNALAARELIEYRKTNGPFKNREQIKSVPQIGDVRFVQAAGRLPVQRDTLYNELRRWQ